jgi:hypothetical protein
MGDAGGRPQEAGPGRGPPPSPPPPLCGGGGEVAFSGRRVAFLEAEGAPSVVEAVRVGEAHVAASCAVLGVAGLHPSLNQDIQASLALAAAPN